MKTLYLDCQMGAAGDMLTAALLELVPDPDSFIDKMNALGIPGVKVEKETAEKCGIQGTHFKVLVHGEEEESHDVHSHEHHHHEHDHHHEHEHTHEHHHHEHDHHHDGEHTHEHHHGHDHHHHSGMHDIEHIVKDHLNLPEKVKEDVMAVYGLIAEAESHAHGVPVTEIHFHEVGTMDAVADITAVCLLMNEINPDVVIASPVHVGYGQVKCAHGILPVPAPATAYILNDVPVLAGSIEGELCTPTGAALLKYFVSRYDQMPAMKIEKIGYGMGKKDFPAANCIRAMLGESEQEMDEIVELACNVDDMTAEEIGFAMERLFEGGALDVYTIPIGMKKNRPGTLIHVMCKTSEKEKIASLLFRYTTTIGIRENRMNRYVLDRTIEEIETPYGKVRRKLVSGYGTERYKYEYDDLARIAKEQNLSLKEVKDQLGSK